MKKDEEEILNTIREHGPMDKHELVDRVYDLEECSECGRVKDEEKLGEAYDEINRILHALHRKNKTTYNLDWEICAVE